MKDLQRDQLITVCNQLRAVVEHWQQVAETASAEREQLRAKVAELEAAVEYCPTLRAAIDALIDEAMQEDAK